MQENRHHIKTTALNLVLFLVVCFIADLAVNSRHFFLIFFCILSLIFVHYIMNILICGPDERKKKLRPLLSFLFTSLFLASIYSASSFCLASSNVPCSRNNFRVSVSSSSSSTSRFSLILSSESKNFLSWTCFFVINITYVSQNLAQQKFQGDSQWAIKFKNVQA